MEHLSLTPKGCMVVELPKSSCLIQPFVSKACNILQGFPCPWSLLLRQLLSSMGIWHTSWECSQACVPWWKLKNVTWEDISHIFPANIHWRYWRWPIHILTPSHENGQPNLTWQAWHLKNYLLVGRTCKFTRSANAAMRMQADPIVNSKPIFFSKSHINSWYTGGVTMKKIVNSSLSRCGLPGVQFLYRKKTINEEYIF